MKRRRVQSIVSASVNLGATILLCQMVGWDVHVFTKQHVDAFTHAFPINGIRHSPLVPSTKRTLLGYRRRGDFDRSDGRIIGAVWNSTSIDSIREQLSLLQTRPTTPCVNETTETFNAQIAAVALRRFTQLLSRNQSNEHEVVSFANGFLPSLLDTMEESIKASDVDLGLNVLTDTLVSFSIIVNSGFCAKIDERRMRSLARFIWAERLQESAGEFVSRSSPSRMVDSLRSALSQQLIRDKGCVPLFDALFERLAQGDALSRLTPFHLSGAIFSLSRNTKRRSTFDCTSLPKLLTAFARRIRKQNVRRQMNTAMLLRTIAATSQIVRDLEQQGERDGGENISKLIADLKTTTYTITKNVVSGCSSQTRQPFAVSEAITLLNAVDVLDLNTKGDPIINELYARLWRDTDTISESASLRQMSFLSKVFLHPNNTSTGSLARQVGNKLATELKKDQFHLQLEPWMVSSLVRYAVLVDSPRPEGSLLDAYQRAFKQCIMEPSFLQRSNAVEISNFCWFMHSTRWEDEAILMALAHRTLEPELQNACTPKIACRLLFTFTSMFETQQKTNAQEDGKTIADSADGGEDLLLQLFQVLGEHLLSTTRLTPLDLSSAIYAYAKASYVGDLGIFDHLIELLASRVEEASSRQIAQSLWACGKMVGFEAQPTPPYYPAALRLARHLCGNADFMTTKDVAQSLWALGRLGVTEENVILPLIHRAQNLANELNTHEVASILWAMSKVKSKEYRVVVDLTRRFTLSGGTVGASSQDVSIILYSLGRLHFRDKYIFRNLSGVIMKQIDETSAQAVANILWAHRAVHLEPPKELLDRWANKKLGIVPVRANGGNASFLK